jgi:hypothetical protein
VGLGGERTQGTFRRSHIPSSGNRMTPVGIAGSLALSLISGEFKPQWV